MLNYIWLGLVLTAVVVGGFSGRTKEMVDGTVDSAKGAVTLSLGLIGIMALWLGMMRLAEKAGLIQTVARLLKPILGWLFPHVPAGHPAMGSMLMNIAANMLGLNNAATPLGLRAMRDLESLNRYPGVATNAMCTFLAINTSSVQLIPMTVVAILAAAGSKNPSAIIGTAFLATLCSALAAITAVKSLEKLTAFRIAKYHGDESSPVASGGGEESRISTAIEPATLPPMPAWGWAALAAFFACFAWFFLALCFPSLSARAAAATPSAQPSARAPADRTSPPPSPVPRTRERRRFMASLPARPDAASAAAVRRCAVR